MDTCPIRYYRESWLQFYFNILSHVDLVLVITMFFSGPNAISVSLSPSNSHVVVGLAAKRIHWHLTSQQVKCWNMHGTNMTE